MLTKPNQHLEIAMHSIDIVRRRYRQYYIAECGSLFGEPALLVSWGRIGAPTRVRVETFADVSARKARYDELVARRGAHGYAAAG